VISGVQSTIPQISALSSNVPKDDQQPELKERKEGQEDLQGQQEQEKGDVKQLQEGLQEDQEHLQGQEGQHQGKSRRNRRRSKKGLSQEGEESIQGQAQQVVEKVCLLFTIT
jgi:hypothetical protein